MRPGANGTAVLASSCALSAAPAGVLVSSCFGGGLEAGLCRAVAGTVLNSAADSAGGGGAGLVQAVPML